MNDQFLYLAGRLKEACEQGEWESVGEIDKQVRKELESSLAKVSDERDKALAISVLKRYQKVYSLIIQGSEKHRDEISDELKKLGRESRAANAYLSSSLYKA